MAAGGTGCAADAVCAGCLAAAASLFGAGLVSAVSLASLLTVAVRPESIGLMRVQLSWPTMPASATAPTTAQGIRPLPLLRPLLRPFADVVRRRPRVAVFAMVRILRRPGLSPRNPFRKVGAWGIRRRREAEPNGRPLR
jgi:hypothetical protein